jgi:hypothetical protein
MIKNKVVPAARVLIIIKSQGYIFNFFKKFETLLNEVQKYIINILKFLKNNSRLNKIVIYKYCMYMYFSVSLFPLFSKRSLEYFSLLKMKFKQENQV